MILRRLTVVPTGSGATLDAILFKNVVRILAISVELANPGSENPSVLWAVLSKDGGLSVPTLFGESAPQDGAAVTPATSYFVNFAPNQGRLPPVEPNGPLVCYTPGYLPPDLWLQPSEQLRLTINGGGDPATVTFVRGIISYLDQEELPDRDRRPVRDTAKPRKKKRG